MGNQSHLEKSRLDPGLSSMLTPVPLPPSACHAHSLSLNDNSAYESLSVLSISLSTLHLLSPSLCHSVHLPLFVCICWSLSPCLFSLPPFPSHSPSFSFPVFLQLSHSLSVSLGLWVSGLCPMSPVQTTSGQSIILGMGGAGGPPRRERRGSSMGRGLQLLQFPVWGGGDNSDHAVEEIPERAIPGAWAPSLGDGLGAGLGGRLKLPRGAGAGPGP